MEVDWLSGSSGGVTAVVERAVNFVSDFGTAQALELPVVSDLFVIDG